VCYDRYEKLVIPIIGSLPLTLLQLKVTFGAHRTEEATCGVAVVSDFFTRTLVESFKVDVENIWDGKSFLRSLVVHNPIFPLYRIGYGLLCVWSSCLRAAIEYVHI